MPARHASDPKSDDPKTDDPKSAPTEPDQPTNRAARRAHAKGGTTDHSEITKSTFPGRRNPTVAPRRWANRRSG